MHDLSPIAYYTVGKNNLLCIRILNTNTMECVCGLWMCEWLWAQVCVIDSLSIAKSF